MSRTPGTDVPRRMESLPQRVTRELWRVMFGSARHKLLLLCLIGLTTLLVLWPISPSPQDPLPVQSVYAIQDLPIFAMTFSAWITCLVVLLFGARGGIWERLILCVAFTVVFIQLWGLASPWGNSGDSTWRTAEVKYLLATGRIPSGGALNFPYFDFPGLHLLTVAIAETTGMDVFLTVRVYLLASGLLLTLFLYTAFLRLLDTPDRAALGVMLAFASSTVLSAVSNQFHPINLSTLYITYFLVLLIRLQRTAHPNWRTLVPLLVLAAAASIEYLFSPVFFFLTLLSGYILNRAVRAGGAITPSLIVFPLVSFLAWDAYVTVWNFPTTVVQFPEALLAILKGGWLIAVQQLLGANIGTGSTWWEGVAKLFWWGSMFGGGTLLMLRRGLGLHAASRPQVELAVFLGMLGTMIPGAFVGGIIGVAHGALTRYVWIAPLFLAPALVQFLTRPTMRLPGIVFACVGLLLLFPTFLANGGHLSTYRTYRYELAAGEFIGSTYGLGDGLTLFCDTSVPEFALLNTPDALTRASSGAYGTTKAMMWQSLEEVISTFRASDPERKLLITWPKMRNEYALLMGIPVNHPNWRQAEQQLSVTLRIYDSGYLQLYRPYE